jgi:hypothetical protein
MAHPNDKLAALDLAIKALREAYAGDALVELTYLPALQELRDDTQREARGG